MANGRKLICRKRQLEKRAIHCPFWLAMPALRIAILVSLLGIGGCRPWGCMIKRESELNCPTDIRQTVPWCAGEDAIFHCPCGPDGSYYGYKPTCWNNWPAGGAEWRDSQCGPPMMNGEGQESGYHPASQPMLMPSNADDIQPEMPPSRIVVPQQQTNGTLPELPFPDGSSINPWPTERSTGPLRPKTAAQDPQSPTAKSATTKSADGNRVGPAAEFAAAQNASGQPSHRPHCARARIAEARGCLGAG